MDATQSAHTELWEYIRSIRDPACSEKDFLTASEKDIADFETQTGLAVKRSIPAGFNGEIIKPSVRIQILSIVKEALNDIRKHAEANMLKYHFPLNRKRLAL